MPRSSRDLQVELDYIRERLRHGGRLSDEERLRLVLQFEGALDLAILGQLERISEQLERQTAQLAQLRARLAP